MLIANEQKRVETEERITRIVLSWIRDLVHDASEAIRDLQYGDLNKAEKVIQDFLKKDGKEMVLIEAQIRLNHHDQNLLKQNSDVITLKHLSEQALAELKNEKKTAAFVLLQKMQMLVADVEKIELSMI